MLNLGHAYYGKKRDKQVKKCDRTSQFENCPYARTFACTVPNPFRTHFRTHIARAEVRKYAHVRRNPTSVDFETKLKIDT